MISIEELYDIFTAHPEITTDSRQCNKGSIFFALKGENFKKAGVEIYSTGNSPYVWAKFPGLKSWDVFDKILKEANVVTTPGSGFGPAGESFIRFSSFGHQESVNEACERLSKLVF